jgi:glycerol-3-phosphate acyltransferase PlsY
MMALAMSWPEGLGALVLGYLLGSIPFGLIFAWLAGAGDVRKIGSGNIGATNVLRTGNRWAAAATLLFDGAKGAAAVLLARRFLGADASLIAAFGAFLGHCFPVWLGFKGGKGVAVFLGVMFALDWLAGTAVALTWLGAAAIWRISSLSALIAAALAPAYLLMLHEWKFAVLASLLAIVIFYMHRENIGRLLGGTEPRIGAKSASS